MCYDANVQMKTELIVYALFNFLFYCKEATPVLLSNFKRGRMLNVSQQSVSTVLPNQTANV